MAMHGLNGLTIGVPNVSATADYYDDFGLTRITAHSSSTASFATTDGGEQLTLAPAARRRLLQMRLGVDDQDDIGRIAASLRGIGVDCVVEGGKLTAKDPGTDVEVLVEVSPRLVQVERPVPAYNSPGVPARGTGRAPGILRTDAVTPRKLGHVVIGSTNQEASEKFFLQGLGMKASDRVPGFAAFMRCSTDHHNVLVQAAPVTMLHHTSWQVDDVDEVGRGATAMLEKDPTRHVWGLGRHHIGSNFFWYLRDPAGNFSEYYSDMDCAIEEQLWTPQDWHDARALYNWGPPPPEEFTTPPDIAEIVAAKMTDAH